MCVCVCVCVCVGGCVCMCACVCVWVSDKHINTNISTLDRYCIRYDCVKGALFQGLGIAMFFQHFSPSFSLLSLIMISSKTFCSKYKNAGFAKLPLYDLVIAQNIKMQGLQNYPYMI